MTDNRKSDLLLEYIKRAERKIGAKEISLQVNSPTFDAIVGEVKPSTDAHLNPTWNGYRVCLNVGMAEQAQIECFISDADDNEYQAILVINDFEDIEDV